MNRTTSRRRATIRISLTIACAALLCACQGPPPKKSNNGEVNNANNTTNNDTTNNNGATNNGDGGTNNQTNNTNNTNNTTNNATNNTNNNGTTNNGTTNNDGTNNQTNNTNNTTTNNGNEQHFVVAIADTSSGDTACNPDSFAPGSDIMWAALEDNFGNVLGHAEVLSDDIDFTDNDFPGIPDHLANGTEPPFGVSRCPEQPVLDDENLVSLGCLGGITVQFVDDFGQPIPLVESEHVIAVGELAAQCSGGSLGDRYDILECDPDVAPSFVTLGDCNVALTSSSVTGEHRELFE